VKNHASALFVREHEASMIFHRQAPAISIIRIRHSRILLRPREPNKFGSAGFFACKMRFFPLG
jgi:hypothetical protein